MWRPRWWRHGAAAAAVLALVAGACVAVQVVFPLPASAVATHPTTIAAGATHSCEIVSGKAYCWGDNTGGQLGNNSTISSNVPVPVYTGGVLSGLTMTQITAGTNFSCALASTGATYCWGLGTGGQLGNTASLSRSQPVLVSGSLNLTEITSGAAFTCGLTSGGVAWCWGAGGSGQLGNGLGTDSNAPVTVSGSGTGSFKLGEIQAGGTSACALTNGHVAWCWGAGGSGQLGNGTATTAQLTPTAVTPGVALNGVTFNQITVGTNFACALAGTTGLAYCWGSNANGQLGTAATPNNVPVAVTVSAPLTGVILTQISAGASTTCAVGNTGTGTTVRAYCWGAGGSGQLGDGSSTASQGTAVAVSAAGVLSNVSLTQISAGAGATCAMPAAGAAYCWGLNSSGQLGNPVTAPAAGGFLVPVAVGVAQPVMIWGGQVHSCEIRSGKAWCWGDNSQGELGNGTTIGSTVPVAVYTGGVLAGVTLTQISAGLNFTCALSSAGAVYCWGSDSFGQLGNNSTTDSRVPVAVSTAGTPMAGVIVTQIGMGGREGCAVSSAGAAYCWGSGSSGQLGNNLATDSHVPVAVTAAGTPMAGAVLTQVLPGSGTFACALSAAGAAYCWGDNTNGQLGNNLTTQANVPVAVTVSGVLAGVALTQLTIGDGFVCALSAAGAAYCWGSGSNGQLGNNSTTDSHVPVAVTASGVLAGKTLTQVSAGGGGSSACALDSAGAAYCWGLNSNGQLGNNSTTQANVPVTVTATGVLAGRTLIQITGGNASTCAMDAAGAAYCWGLNSSGQLGNPDTALNFLVAVQVMSQSTTISAGDTHSCLLRDGKAWCWGDNSSGELGIGATPTQSLVPVAVSTSGVLNTKTLVQISAGDDWTCALDTAGAAYCWGNNATSTINTDQIALGNGLQTASAVPVAVTMNSLIFTQISVGSDFACALTSSGVAYCWGNDHNGQMGNSSNTAGLVPTAVTTSGMPAGTVLTQIVAGGNEALGNFGCAETSTGAAYCWGLGTGGQLGNSTNTSTTSASVKVTATGSALYRQVATGGSSSCALGTTAAAEGLAYCWGVGGSGQLGNTGNSDSNFPVAVTISTPLTGVTLTQVTSGNNFACALGNAGAATPGAAYCWGLGTSGQLGNTASASSNAPVAVTPTAGVILAQISSGTAHTCTEDSTGAFACWGDNANGDLGNNSTTPSNFPVTVQGEIPAAPTGVTATPGDTTATISWTASTSFGTGTFTGYTATATAASGSFSCSTSSLTCVITGLTDGTTYSVTVVTHTTDGDSPPSSPAVTVTPVATMSLTSPSSLTWAVSGIGVDMTVVDAVAGDQQLTATDNTGTGLGWHITVSATTFTTGTKSLPDTGAVDFTGSVTSSLASTAPSATCVGSCTLPTDMTTYPVIITTAASSPTIYTTYDTSAATGQGVMTIGGSSAANPIGWWVQVPGSTYAGSYTSTVSLEIISGP